MASVENKQDHLKNFIRSIIARYVNVKHLNARLDKDTSINMLIIKMLYYEIKQFLLLNKTKGKDNIKTAFDKIITQMNEFLFLRGQFSSAAISLLGNICDELLKYPNLEIIYTNLTIFDTDFGKVDNLDNISLAIALFEPTTMDRLSLRLKGIITGIVYITDQNNIGQYVAIIKNILKIMLCYCAFQYLGDPMKIDTDTDIENVFETNKDKIQEIIFFPKFRTRKTPLFNFVQLTTQSDIIEKYYGDHFDHFFTFIFGFFVYLLKRDISVSGNTILSTNYPYCRKFLQLLLLYLGFTDPTLSINLQNEGRIDEEEPVEHITKISEVDFLEKTNTPDEGINDIFSKWLGNKANEIDNITTKMEYFLNQFIDSLNFLLDDFPKISLKYSYFRTSVDTLLDSCRDDIMKKTPTNRKSQIQEPAGIYQYFPVVSKYFFWDADKNNVVWKGYHSEIVHTEPPVQTLEEIHHKMKDDFTFYDYHTLILELQSLINTDYRDIFLEHKKNMGGDIPTIYEQETTGIGFINFNNFIKSNLPIRQNKQLSSKLLNMITLMRQLNEVDVVRQLLKKFMINNKPTKWYFTEMSEENVFDELFSQVFLEHNQYIMKTFVMISNFYGGKYENSITGLSSLWKNELNIFKPIVTNASRDDFKAIWTFSYQIMRILYQIVNYQSITRRLPQYSTYYIVHMILQWYMLNILNIMGFYGDSKNYIMLFEKTTAHNPNITDVDSLKNNFPNSLEWYDSKDIKFFSFGLRDNYLLDYLQTMGLMMLFGCDTPLGTDNVNQKNGLYRPMRISVGTSHLGETGQKEQMFLRYNLPTNLFIHNSLTLPSKVSNIFTTEELVTLKNIFQSIFPTIIRYIAITKERIAPVGKLTLKSVKRFCEKFDKAYLHMNITEEEGTSEFGLIREKVKRTPDPTIDIKNLTTIANGLFRMMEIIRNVLKGLKLIETTRVRQLISLLFIPYGSSLLKVEVIMKILSFNTQPSISRIPYIPQPTGYTLNQELLSSLSNFEIHGTKAITPVPIMSIYLTIAAGQTENPQFNLHTNIIERNINLINVAYRHYRKFILDIKLLKS